MIAFTFQAVPWYMTLCAALVTMIIVVMATEFVCKCGAAIWRRLRK